MPMDWGLARDYAARDVHVEEAPVTDAEWLAAADPEPMLELLEGKASNRKLRLFAAACCRHVWTRLVDDRSRRAVEFAERFVDLPGDRPDLALIRGTAWDAVS